MLFLVISLDDDNRRLMFPVKIIDDDLFESVEELNLELKFNLFGDMTAPSREMLSPNVSNVRSLDDDGNRALINLLLYQSFIACLQQSNYVYGLCEYVPGFDVRVTVDFLINRWRMEQLVSTLMIYATSVEKMAHLTMVDRLQYHFLHSSRVLCRHNI